MEFYRLYREKNPAPKFNAKNQLLAEMEKHRDAAEIKPGMEIGICVGSRGIADIQTLVRTTVDFVTDRGAVPTVIACMGSHGGGTPEGQLEILRGLGVDSKKAGAKVVSSCASTRVGEIQGVPLYVDNAALKCDALIIINRVKPHTAFRGEIESGLTKMVVVGVGGPLGAQALHSRGAAEIARLLPEMGSALLSKLPILFGIAVVEGEDHETRSLEVCAKEEFLKKDHELLKQAKSLLPKLPFDNIDVLVVQEMGKCFSGTGMDTNVIGRFGIKGVKDEKPFIAYIVVLDLADKSKGNANGIGLADVSTRKLYRKIDYQKTLKNVLTTTFLERARLPVIMETDKEAIDAAISASMKPPAETRLVFIRNTLELGEIHATRPLIEEVRGRKGIVVAPEPLRIVFDTAGNFRKFDSA